MEGKFDVIITDKLCKQCGICSALCPKHICVTAFLIF